MAARPAHRWAGPRVEGPSWLCFKAVSGGGRNPALRQGLHPMTPAVPASSCLEPSGNLHIFLKTLNPQGLIRTLQKILYISFYRGKWKAQAKVVMELPWTHHLTLTFSTNFLCYPTPTSTPRLLPRTRLHRSKPQTSRHCDAALLPPGRAPEEGRRVVIRGMWETERPGFERPVTY